MRTASFLLLSLPLASAFLAPPPASYPWMHQCASSVRGGVARVLKSAQNALTDDGNSVRSLLSKYEELREQKRLAEALEEAAQAAVEKQQQMMASIRAATESKEFLAVEGLYVVVSLALLDAAFSGDWTRNGLITYAMEDKLKVAMQAVSVAHVVLATLSGFMVVAKEREGAPLNALRTLLVGGLDFFRVSFMEDKYEMEQRQAAALPALSMEMSTFQMESTKLSDGVVLSTSIRTKHTTHVAMRKLLEKLVEESTGDKSVATMAVNQDPQDRRNFVILQRFPSQTAMKQYQNADAFMTFVKDAEELLSEPMGLYLTSERMGKLTEPRYPFGPGGEGGRDDAIYSSPTNLDGSQVRHGNRELVSN